MEESSRPVTFVVPGDLHLTTRGRENYEAALCVIRDANELIDPDFVQFIGDNVQDAKDEQFQLFKELTDLLEVPHFVLVGDHDICGDAKATRFRDLVGEPYGSTELRQFRFVRLNTLETPPLGFTDRQLSWLDCEFETARINGQSVILFQHHYPYKVCEDFVGPGVRRWRELVNSHRPVAVVCGHTHYHQIANDGSTIAIAARSIGDPEGGAPGYLVGHAQDGDFSVTYRTIDDLCPLVLITHPRDLLMATGPRHVVKGVDELRVRIWSKCPVSRVTASLDDAAWFELRSRGDGNWAAPLHGSQLPKGEHRVSVEAHASDGGQGRQQISFFADTTGRFTAVPTSRPVVRTTAFC
jgi:3',5'-cyclic-AMP phosphodiesterase